jgi:hypothetical protein
MTDWDQYRKDIIHKVLAGYPTSRPQLIAAGLFVAAWFMMDLIEFVDWGYGKLNAAGSACTVIPLGLPPYALPSAPSPEQTHTEGLKINIKGY